MVAFSSDIDILKYEPALFGFLHIPWQVLCSGESASLESGTLIDQNAHFLTAGVTAGKIIYVRGSDGVPDGAYEIVSVESATELVVSVLRSDSSGAVVAPPSAESVSWRIATLEPQASEIGLQLTAYFGLGPGCPTAEYDASDIVDPEMLRQASVFAVISLAYGMVAGNSNDEHLWSKSMHYKKLFTKARERIRFSIDTGGEEISNINRIGGSGRLIRD